MGEKDRTLRCAIDNHLTRGVENLQMHVGDKLGALAVAAPRELKFEWIHASLGAQGLGFLLPNAAVHVVDMGIDHRLKVRAVSARNGEGAGEDNGSQYKPGGH